MASQGAATSPVRYTIDKKASQFTVQAFASGLVSVVAHSPKIAIRDWTGEISFVPDTLEAARLKVSIKAGSLDVLDDLRENDRRELHRVMYDEVLEIKEYPTVEFESATISSEKKADLLYRINVTGLLALHGVTNTHSLFAQVAFGVGSFRAYGEFTLLQTDYNMEIASIAGGTLKLKDELKFTFYVVAREE